MMHTDHCVLRALAILRSFAIRPIGLLAHDLAGTKLMHLHAAQASLSVMHTNRCALRALAILRSFAIRPIGLLAHDLAGPNLVLSHASMARTSFWTLVHHIFSGASKPNRSMPVSRTFLVRVIRRM